MEEWKIRQDLYHKLNKDYSDDLNKVKISFDKDIVNNAIKYFNDTEIGWIYPAKSYMVAICYSKWLSDFFGKHPLDYLNDSQLLYNNDPYFITYEKDFTTYDKILKKINYWQFCEKSGMVPDVKNYFIEEFMINEYGI